MKYSSIEVGGSFIINQSFTLVFWLVIQLKGKKSLFNQNGIYTAMPLSYSSLQDMFTLISSN